MNVDSIDIINFFFKYFVNYFRNVGVPHEDVKVRVAKGL